MSLGIIEPNSHKQRWQLCKNYENLISYTTHFKADGQAFQKKKPTIVLVYFLWYENLRQGIKNDRDDKGQGFHRTVIGG